MSFMAIEKQLRQGGKAVAMCIPYSLRDLQLETPHPGALGEMVQPQAELYFLCGAGI